MPESRKSADPLIYVGLTLAVFCVPCSIPLAVTVVAWCFGVPMRLSLLGSLFVTFVMFAVWFIVSEIGGVFLRRLQVGNRALATLLSNLPSFMVLALGYWLVFDAAVAALLAAAMVFGLSACLSPLIEYWHDKAAPDSGST